MNQNHNHFGSFRLTFLKWFNLLKLLDFDNRGFFVKMGYSEVQFGADLLRIESDVESTILLQDLGRTFAFCGLLPAWCAVEGVQVAMGMNGSGNILEEILTVMALVAVG